MKPWICLVIKLLMGIPCISLHASVSPNPFLRPGSQQKPPASQIPKFTPKPVPQKDISKEMEFRGYFLLKGKPYFCLFNKKSNHAEWISLSENTYEEFTASEFDMESELLTVVYEGSSYQLSLLQGGSSLGTTKSNSIPSLPSISNKANSSSYETPRYMPPRPKTAPQLPDWLVKKNAPSFPSAGNSINGTKVGYSSDVPRRIVPGLPLPFPQDRVNISSSSANQNAGVNTSRNSFIQRINRKADDTSLLNSSGDSSFDNVIEDTVNSSSTGTAFDLESLPPPPPPPNITPPSPPPDILPSREN